MTFAARETFESWRNVSGGMRVGDTTLNKLQISGTWTANAWSNPGFRLHAQVFRTNGERLTSRVGDLQTVSNIEALSTDRLFEAWAEQSFGKPTQGGVAVRVGLIDLNSDFDSIEPAALFIDSSHGIAPDLSKSGRNGPSIFPVSSAAVRLTWTPTEDWTVRGGVFDGVPGDPQHPKAFAAVRLSSEDGALGIAEVDHKLGKDAQVSLGAWRYTTASATLDGAIRSHDSGVFGYVEGPVPRLEGWSGWVRAGWGNRDVQVVSGYVGGGVVRKGLVAGRSDDRLGFAVSRAAIAPAAQRLQGLRAAETTWEATYQVKVADWIAVQPDVQYLVHPSGRAGLPNVLVVGLRVVLTAGYPKKAPATEQADPTVPPDNPAEAPPT
ncbi:carbohydrate porin [Phenylobacterium sp.]|uniref:carbohydrate porin n=1 Tax=Phenylobacterium sp. TaxID=1871053 RepID=UPI00374DA726